MLDAATRIMRVCDELIRAAVSNEDRFGSITDELRVAVCGYEVLSDIWTYL